MDAIADGAGAAAGADAGAAEGAGAGAGDRAGDDAAAGAADLADFISATVMSNGVRRQFSISADVRTSRSVDSYNGSSKYCLCYMSGRARDSCQGSTHIFAQYTTKFTLVL